MRNLRFILSAASTLSILAGGLLLSTPQPAAAATAGCPTASVKEAVSDLRDICGSAGGSGVINCYSDGSWDWSSVSCN
jgi:hypothetical protein